MAYSGDFSKAVPGFDFLQGLMKTGGSALPGMGQWIAPTLDPEELEKRIEELRTVQFWLEQNARMLAATVQALEVQRMTLSTLKTMNVPVADVAEAFKIRPASGPAPKAEPAPAAAAGVVDPLQWWGALTQQFTELVAKTLKEQGSATAPKATPAPKAESGTGATPKPEATPKTTRARRSR